MNILETKKINKIIDYLDLDLIITEVIKKNRAFILAHPEYKLSLKQEKLISKMIKRRAAGESLAYILGYKEFYGRKFLVNKNTLVPRPETELMIDEVKNLSQKLILNKQKINILDIGTGSGCIIITLAKELNKNKINFFASDISRPALNTARKNAVLNKIKKIKFFTANLLDQVARNNILKNLSTGRQVIPLIITANLPYLKTSEIKKYPSIQFEPKIALDGGRDGLMLYRQLFKQVKNLKNIFIFCEIYDQQADKIKKAAENILPQASIEIKKDLAGKKRLAIINYSNL